MLRMAHRIATTGLNGVSAPVECSESTCRAMASNYLDIQREARSAFVLIADDVADFYASHPQEEWDFISDFPNCMPFVSPLLIEWREPSTWQIGDEIKSGAAPGSMAAVLVKTLEVTDSLLTQFEAAKLQGFDLDIPDPTRWVLRFDMLVFGRCRLALSNMAFLLPLNEIGVPIRGPNLIGYGDSSRSDSSYIDAMSTALHVPALAMSFANCKNVARRDATSQVGPTEKWIRRQKAPTIRYHVLDINPMKEVLRTEGGIASNGFKKAFHICRGHFRRCERPFGRDKPETMWISPHVRGSIEHGIVDKDYRLKLDVAP